jgi:RNA polymerase sigma-70 factor (ECF subfamily)
MRDTREPMTEAELIRRAAGGDEAAWASLVRAHQQAVFRLAWLLLGDAGEAEDLAQEVFLRAIPALGRFDAARPLRPWLLQIARNLASNRRRSLRRMWAALRRAQPAGDPAHASGAGVEDADALWRAVRRLPAADQEVIYLRCFLELPVEEVAVALGVAPGTVKSRLSRALERLRPLVEVEFPERATADKMTR